jgi:hypothetical protein
VVKKIAVSMAEPIFREMERSRKRARLTRSGWLQAAAEERLARITHEDRVAADIRGYTEHPETDEEVAEIEAWLRVAPTYDDEWPEAPS